MSELNTKVILAYNDLFTGRMRAAAEAAHAMHARMELDRATWEPHDWDAF